jgi:hypothetical protein
MFLPRRYRTLWVVFASVSAWHAQLTPDQMSAVAAYIWGLSRRPRATSTETTGQ